MPLGHELRHGRYFLEARPSRKLGAFVCAFCARSGEEEQEHEQEHEQGLVATNGCLETSLSQRDPLPLFHRPVCGSRDRHQPRPDDRVRFRAASLADGLDERANLLEAARVRL